MTVSLNLVTFAAMNKKDKLVKRFRTLPRDFTFEEVVTLFKAMGLNLRIKEQLPVRALSFKEQLYKIGG